jgi:chemotaxis signal transduction protein
MRTHPGATAKTGNVCSLIVFSVGGRRLATRIEEVGGVWAWSEPTAVPSHTPHVRAVLRHGEEVLPVYDLAGKLNARMTGSAALCLVVKTTQGPMVIRIDDAVPSMQAVALEDIERSDGQESLQIGTCRFGSEMVPVYSFKALGVA